MSIFNQLFIWCYFSRFFFLLAIWINPILNQPKHSTNHIVLCLTQNAIRLKIATTKYKKQSCFERNFFIMTHLKIIFILVYSFFFFFNQPLVLKLFHSFESSLLGTNAYPCFSFNHLVSGSVAKFSKKSILV